MKLIENTFDRILLRSLTVFLLLFCVVFAAVPIPAQELPAAVAVDAKPQTGEGGDLAAGFRVEKILVDGGSELITIFAKRQYHDGPMLGPVVDIPLVSLLRDTLGDENPENDRLRYVWMLTYTKPSFSQKVSAFVPFLYTRTTNKGKIGTGPPPSVLDVQTSDKPLWKDVFWLIMKKYVLNQVTPVNMTTLHYRQNVSDYRKSAVASALTVLSLYQEIEGGTALSAAELRDIQARLSLSDKMLGWNMQSENLTRVYEKETTLTRDFRGHNWELLRQYSERQGLYFEPLKMPDDTARHAIVWTTAEDVKANKGKKFDRRFLNIKNPWTDDRLPGWKGYTQVRWFDADDRPVEPDTPNAKSRTMIPLALYGLDYPKIPVILVDFRDKNNPKMREMSKRILNDVTTNVLELSKFSSWGYFFGRFIYEFAAGRRGMDLNQPSRLQSYAQLKLLMSLDASLDAEFRDDISDRVEAATLNPLQNDAQVELKLARAQYDNLIAYAKRPDGLTKKVSDDRREEMVRLKHGRKEAAWFSIANVVSFGLYTHREKETPELLAQLDVRRRLDFHERVLNEVAYYSADPEIDSNVAELKQALMYVSQHGSAARDKTARALARIFTISTDEDVKTLSLAGLYRVNNSTAKKELLAIHNDSKVADPWRNICANYLRLALQERQRISSRDVQSITAMGTN